MAMAGEARYRVIDPQATGFDAVDRAFENQVAYCRDNGAPITAEVCAGLRTLLHNGEGGEVMRRVRGWTGAPLADALPLRLAGGLHALRLTGTEPLLAPLYEGQAVKGLPVLLAEVLERHEAFLLPWLDGPPQTNEAGRSWGYAAAMLWLAEQGLPPRFELLEIGSSAGINLMMARYRYDLCGVPVGPVDAAMRIAPDWRGLPPPVREIAIVGARGCDVAPVDLGDEAQAMRLKAYTWPELTERVARMAIAVAEAKRSPPLIARQRGEAFVAEALDRPQEEGTTRVVMHSVVWQYIPADERERITASLEAAGGRATPGQALAHVSLEANRDTHRHELQVRFWPGGAEWRKLGTAHPHGAWAEWDG